MTACLSALLALILVFYAPLKTNAAIYDGQVVLTGIHTCSTMSAVIIEELDSSEEDFGTPTSKHSADDTFHSPGGSENDLKGDMI